MASGANDHTVRIWDCGLLPQPDSKPAGAQSPGQNDETRALIHTGETMYTLLELYGEHILQGSAAAPWESSCISLVSLC